MTPSEVLDGAANAIVNRFRKRLAQWPLYDSNLRIWAHKTFEGDWCVGYGSGRPFDRELGTSLDLQVSGPVLYLLNRRAEQGGAEMLAANPRQRH